MTVILLLNVYLFMLPKAPYPMILLHIVLGKRVSLVEWVRIASVANEIATRTKHFKPEALVNLPLCPSLLSYSWTFHFLLLPSLPALPPHPQHYKTPKVRNLFQCV